MRKLFLVASFLIAPLVSAQELVEFENGQVADADDLNGNLNLLMTKISALEARVLALEAQPVSDTAYTASIGSALQPDQLTFAAESTAFAYVEEGVSKGKHYWEITAQCGPDTLGVNMGIIGAASLPSRPEMLDQNGVTGSDDEMYIASDGARLFRGNRSNDVDGWEFQSTASNDVFSIALDLTSNSVFLGKNGVWAGAADPANNRNPSFEGFTGVYHAFIGGGARECIPNTFVTNFGASNFSYDVPSGYFKGYCPSNDCEIAE